MDPGIFIFLVMLLSALPLYIIAYLIGVKKHVGLIAGSAPDRITNKTGLAHWVGLLIFMIGVVIVLMGLGICLFIGKALTITLGRCRADHGPDHHPSRRHPTIRHLTDSQTPH